MTEEQIIKAFEEMAEDNRMPIINQCICSNVLNLINRQKAKTERWKMVIEQIENDLQPLPFETNFEKAAKRIKSEAIKEFADKINELLTRYSHLHDYADNARRDTIEAADGTDIEMQSVWDVFTLKNNEMSEYEEMNRLQKNIETIAEERLLKEIEKDFRLLVKEMTEVRNEKIYSDRV